jgi:hypothetical protein
LGYEDVPACFFHKAFTIGGRKDLTKIVDSKVFWTAVRDHIVLKSPLLE